MFNLTSEQLSSIIAICYVLMYTSLLVITGIVFFSAFLLIKSYLLNLITI